MKTSTALLSTLVTLTLVELSIAKRGNRGPRCKYDKGNWSDCDTATLKSSRTLTLKPEQPEHCEPTKTISRDCTGDGPVRRGEGRGNKCKYDKGDWSDCDDTTNERSRTLTLRRGRSENCEQTKIDTKSCKANSKNEKPNRRRNRGKNKIYSCQYSVAEISECDDANKTRTVTLTLKRGLPSICEQSKSFSRPCQDGQEDADGCVYGRPVVGDCVNNEKTITRTLEDGDPAVCDATKTKSKKCNGEKGNREDRRSERKAAKKAARKARRKERKQGDQD